MAIGSATSSSAAISQSILQTLKLQDAKRSAEQAQFRAQDLQNQAADEQRVADNAQEKARSLRVEANQAQADVGRASQGLQALQSLSQMSSRLDQIYTQVAQKQHDSLPTSSAQAPQQGPTVNSQGQVTGRIINTTA